MTPFFSLVLDEQLDDSWQDLYKDWGVIKYIQNNNIPDNKTSDLSWSEIKVEGEWKKNNCLQMTDKRSMWSMLL